MLLTETESFLWKTCRVAPMFCARWIYKSHWDGIMVFTWLRVSSVPALCKGKSALFPSKHLIWIAISFVVIFNSCTMFMHGGNDFNAKTDFDWVLDVWDMKLASSWIIRAMLQPSLESQSFIESSISSSSCSLSYNILSI